MRSIFGARKSGKGELLQDHVWPILGAKRGFAVLKPIKSSIRDRKGECLRGPVDSMCRYGGPRKLPKVRLCGSSGVSVGRLFLNANSTE
jgi:hypothetical protein